MGTTEYLTGFPPDTPPCSRALRVLTKAGGQSTAPEVPLVPLEAGSEWQEQSRGCGGQEYGRRTETKVGGVPLPHPPQLEACVEGQK